MVRRPIRNLHDVVDNDASPPVIGTTFEHVQRPSVERSFTYPSSKHIQRSTMAFLAPRRLVAIILLLVAFVYAEKHAASIASMSIPEIEEKIQVQTKRNRAEALPAEHPSH